MDYLLSWLHSGPLAPLASCERTWLTSTMLPSKIIQLVPPLPQVQSATPQLGNSSCCTFILLKSRQESTVSLLPPGKLYYIDYTPTKTHTSSAVSVGEGTCSAVLATNK
ncbi:hypothetical protein AMECASPLE_003535 [Ameca splendens]|uniref:Uncharacterized protein n=1 Tax=Ameca splendens TaxID=208324 RepID=A0ABV0ZJ14_9TELE